MADYSGSLYDAAQGDDIQSETNKTAQSIAEQQGVAYSDIAKETENQPATQFAAYDQQDVKDKIDTTIDYKDGLSYLNNAGTTVAGQLESLLSSDSKYITQARQRASEAAGSRGLLNSSMAMGAGEQAAISQALPIAQQDAQTFAEFQSRKQAADYQTQQMQSEGIVSGGLVQQEASIARQQQNIDNAFQAVMQGAAAQDKTWLSDLQNTYNTNMQGLEAASQAALLSAEIDSQIAQTVGEQATVAMQNYQIFVENVLTDPDFLDLDAEAVNNAINGMNTLTKNHIDFLYTANGVDLSSEIDSFFQPVGFR